MDEEFLATLKLMTGEEIVAKVCYLEDEDKVLLENPLQVESAKQRKGQLEVSGFSFKEWISATFDNMFIIKRDHIMTMTEVDKLRAWHRKQDIVWQEGYDVWGKVIADHLVAKSKRSSERVRDFYNHKIYGERSVGSTFADFVIYPMAYVIGAYKVASSKIKTFKEKANC